jgi:hypothetical protein
MFEPSLGEELDRKSPFDRLTKKAAFAVTLAAVMLYFAFAFITSPAKARVASIATAMILTAVWMRWDLRKHVWFWVTVGMLALMHIPLVTLFPWTNENYPGAVLLPEALLDLAVIYGSIKLVEKLTCGRHASHGQDG